MIIISSFVNTERKKQITYHWLSTHVTEMKEKLHVPSRIRTRVSPLLVGCDIHYTIRSTTLDTYVATYRCVDLERSQSTGHFSFETFVCIMAKSQIKFGLRDRQKFS